MRTFLPLLALVTVFAATAFSKDEVISLDRCPAPVQKVIQSYAAQNQVEEIGFDKKTKTGGPPVYEVKLKGKDGKRFEVHISPDGKVLEVEPKKPKS